MIMYKKEIKPQNEINPVYQTKPIIAFEFAKTPAEINQLFFNKDKQVINKAFVDKMKELNYIDFIFIISYSLILLYFSLTIAQNKLAVLGYIGASIAVIVGIADILENFQLLGILDKLKPSESYEPELSNLYIWTWTKWGLISVLIIVVLPCLFRQQSSIFTLALGVIMSIVAILGFVAYFSQCQTWISHYTGSIFLLFFIIILYSLARWRMWIKS